MNSIISLGQYVGKGKTFVVPDYQRGYIWGKNRIGKKNSVEYLIDDLILHFQNGTEVFLQGFTVNETDNELYLIDGQQRTTFLFFLLKKLGYTGSLHIRYMIRTQSNDFLANEEEWLNQEVIERPDEEYQDIYFFKKTIRIIGEKIRGLNRQDFSEFLLNHVKFLYINIVLKEEATRIFKMMNGSKADMKQEEIIKAEILRLASSGAGDSDSTLEWENNQLRSRYAREWDKWLHWWNREDVRSVFDCSNPMGLLISSYAKKKRDETLTFEGFRNLFLSHGKPIEAKRVFDDLRRLQKRFEDAFNTPETRNRVGAILRLLNWDNRNKFIRHYFVEDHRDPVELRQYYMAAFIGMTHDEIELKDTKEFERKYDSAFQSVQDDFLYGGKDKDFAFNLLLRLNIDQDIVQGRCFNFDIWSNRSLEHIYPKSKVGHEDENGKWLDGSDEPTSDFTLRRDQIKATVGGQTIVTTEHGIGNLVLLYKNENSKFSDYDFAQKKVLFFSPNSKELVKSRHLLHTICVFAEKEKWDGKAIAENKYQTVRKFEEDYKELKALFHDEEQD